MSLKNKDNYYLRLLFGLFVANHVDCQTLFLTHQLSQINGETVGIV